MGERKGVNKYYPPDYDPSKGGLNKFQGTHALRERARKLHMGILIIRFEMPYNIWCEGCENHIGTGVRYNAEKKKVGMYYSTPIYQFRMKCHLCDNHFEIKTDPANLDYVIVSGARRQERRWDPTENEQVVPEEKEVTRKMATDAMFKLEHGVGDKEKSKEVEDALEALQDFQSSRWQDDFSSNRALRESMRVKRVKEKIQAKKDASYQLSVPLLPPDENDIKTAKLLQFSQTKTCDQLQKEKREIIDAQSVFARLKTKPVSPVVKKAFARQSVEGIVTNSQKNFTSFKNNLKPQNLGIIHKKNNSETKSAKLKDAALENNTDESIGKSRRLSSQNECSTNASTEVLPPTPSSSLSFSADPMVFPSSSSDFVERRTISATSEESSKGDHLPNETLKGDFQKVSVTGERVQSLVGYDYSGSDSD